MFSKIAPQNTNSDRCSPKSRILIPISLGKNVKFIEFGKPSVYVRQRERGRERERQRDRERERERKCVCERESIKPTQ